MFRNGSAPCGRSLLTKQAVYRPLADFPPRTSRVPCSWAAGCAGAHSRSSTRPATEGPDRAPFPGKEFCRNTTLRLTTWQLTAWSALHRGYAAINNWRCASWLYRFSIWAFFYQSMQEALLKWIAPEAFALAVTSSRLARQCQGHARCCVFGHSIKEKRIHKASISACAD